jgi:hypothetical protein
MTLHPIPSEFLYMRKIIFFISVRTYRLIFWSSDSLCGVGTLLATGTESSNAFKYPHCNENPIYVFPEKEFRGLSPNFHIHVTVSDSHILRIGPHIFLH